SNQEDKMRFKNLASVLMIILLALPECVLCQSGKPQSERKDNSPAATPNASQDQDQTEGPHQGPSSAAEAAKRIRRTMPVIPSLVRGGDALLSLNGQRAIQTQLVTSSNVKEPTVDAFPFVGGLPVEASEQVQ